MIIVKEVKTKKQQKEFVNFPLKLYDKCPYFVPPLYMEEMKLFKKNYVYYDQSEAKYFLAYLNNQVVGRISGILQKASNEKWQQRRIRFTRFDAINKQEVANALFDAIKDWALSLGMNELVGPLGFSDLEREGLLIEGFDELSTFEEQYNYDYYQKLIENYGFEKEVDWVERKLYLPEVVDPRLERISNMMMQKHKLRFAVGKNMNDFIKKYGDQFFEILDKTYVNIYGSVPFTQNMKKMLMSNFKLICNVNQTTVILNENDEVVGFGLCMPSIAKAVQKSKGHLTIPALFRLLKAIKNPEIIDLALIGVLPEYQMKGVGSAMIAGIQKMLKNDNIKYAETNLNLEDNHNIQNQWKHFNSILHKRRRCFVKKI